MALADIVYKATAGALGLATLVFAADLVHAMTKQAIVGKTPVRLLCDQSKALRTTTVSPRFDGTQITT